MDLAGSIYVSSSQSVQQPEAISWWNWMNQPFGPRLYVAGGCLVRHRYIHKEHEEKLGSWVESSSDLRYPDSDSQSLSISVIWSQKNTHKSNKLCPTSALLHGSPLSLIRKDGLGKWIFLRQLLRWSAGLVEAGILWSWRSRWSFGALVLWMLFL